MAKKRKEETLINKDRILASLKSDERRNITFSFPTKLLERFREDCEKNEVKMNQVIQKLIEVYLEQNDN